MHRPPVEQMSAVQRLALVRQLRQVLARDSKNVEAHLALSAMLFADRNYGDGLAHLQKAASLRKRDPEILSRLTNAALDAKELATARKYARKLCEVQPRKANNHRLLGLVHMDMGNPGSALQAFQKADRLAPGDVDTLNFIGNCYSAQGDHENAIRQYEKVLEIDPVEPDALYHIAHAKKFSAGDVDQFIAIVRESIDSHDDAHDRANLYHVMGKALDDAGRYAEAFECFSRGNELRVPERQESFQHSFTNNEATFTKAFFAEHGDFGHESDSPVFILGMPRSGTTLVESLCGAHSKIAAGDEQTAMLAINKRLGRDSEIEGAYRRNIEALSRDQVRELAEEYLQFFRPIAGASPRFTDKLPHNFLNIGMIALLFPNARIIHCRRHPMANCLSLFANSMRKFHNTYKTDLDRLGIYYRQYEQLMRHWRAVSPIPLHEVFYEDLVANTEAAARAMIAYLGLEWEDGVMRREGSQRSVKTLSSWQVRQPVYQTSREKWRNYQAQLAPLAKSIGACVEEYERELAVLDGACEAAR